MWSQKFTILKPRPVKVKGPINNFEWNNFFTTFQLKLNCFNFFINRPVCNFRSRRFSLGKNQSLFGKEFKFFLRFFFFFCLKTFSRTIIHDRTSEPNAKSIFCYCFIFVCYCFVLFCLFVFLLLKLSGRNFVSEKFPITLLTFFHLVKCIELKKLTLNLIRVFSITFKLI